MIGIHGRIIIHLVARKTISRGAFEAVGMAGCAVDCAMSASKRVHQIVDKITGTPTSGKHTVTTFAIRIKANDFVIRLCGCRIIFSVAEITVGRRAHIVASYGPSVASLTINPFVSTH